MKKELTPNLTKVLFVKIDAALHKETTAAAKRAKLSKSEYVRRAVEAANNSTERKGGNE